MVTLISTRRTLLCRLSGLAAIPLLSSCGTFIYPDRVNQKEHGGLDPAIVILDGIGLFFFIIPGLIAFAVDFGTNAIYFPEGQDKSDTERTIFEHWEKDVSEDTAINQETIERFITRQTGQRIKLEQENVRVKKLESLDQLQLTYLQFSTADRFAWR